ncbi:MAG: hypothetical protein IPO63_13125 [Bacteroidetes bacterium]|nr:hypothetical protein [Bacteroidota bacterium]
MKFLICIYLLFLFPKFVLGQQDVCNLNCDYSFDFVIGPSLFPEIHDPKLNSFIDFGDGQGIQEIKNFTKIKITYSAAGAYPIKTCRIA